MSAPSRIQCASAPEHVVVDVVDEGPGIPKEVQAKIFDPFFTTKGVGEGTGLGLDVARRIVSGRYGGSIDCASRPGETRFRVRLLPDYSCDAPSSTPATITES